MKRILACSILLLGATSGISAQTPESEIRTTFRVRYVAPDAVYIEAGRNAGLAEGTMLVLKPSPKAETAEQVSVDAGKKAAEPAAASDAVQAPPEPIATLRVVSVADTSAVCEVVSTKRPIVAGDVVSLPNDEVEKLVAKRALSSTRQYPVVVSFTEGDPLDEEVRDSVPRPPLPEINQASGRIGFDFSATRGSGGFNSSQVGFVMRTDITRIGGTHWNLTGYWRGELRSSSSQSTATMQDLINHTYQFGLTYSNPKSPWLLGIGRLYLPWASSLGVIDGTYGARKLSKTATVGMFAGLQQDPTTWDYNPNRRVGGGFINFDGGDYDDFKYSSTFGVGINTLGWQIDRPFGFAENVVSYKHVLSIYHALQVDSPSVGPGQTAVAPGVQSSYFSLRITPTRRVSFDLNHTYYRDVPTYDLQLVGTGLLDKMLFQGVSAGVRVETFRHITLYTDIGRNSNSKDAKSSWNSMFGASLGRIWKTGITADVRYAKFTSTFADGSYKSLMLSRNVSENLRLNLQLGRESYTATTSTNAGSNFFNLSVDMNLGRRYFMEGGVNVQRGGLSYTQWYTTLGYRFDNRHKFGGPSAVQK